ncbi:MAG: hypothetical protein RL536_651 [Candidatus Parcubacteria bacterium]
MNIKKPLLIAFGSQVSGRATPASDFDFGVYLGHPLSLDDRAFFSESLANRFQINEDKIDLIDLFSVSPLLKFEAARGGKLVEGDPSDFTRFKVRSFREYQDTAKFRRLRERSIMKSHVQ